VSCPLAEGCSPCLSLTIQLNLLSVRIAAACAAEQTAAAVGRLSWIRRRPWSVAHVARKHAPSLAACWDLAHVPTSWTHFFPPYSYATLRKRYSTWPAPRKFTPAQPLSITDMRPDLGLPFRARGPRRGAKRQAGLLWQRLCQSHRFASLVGR